MSNEAPVGDSKAIVSNQQGIHDNLEAIVQKHLSHDFKKPFNQHTLDAFADANKRVQAHKGPIILDACCGVGQSTRILAKRNPDALVIGVDKSANRLTRQIDDNWQVDNYLLVRADLNDFFRLVVEHQWPVTEHFILYPNPWPKSKHIGRRWHGAAVFPYIVKIGQQITLRSNWQLYLEEFAFAAELACKQTQLTTVNDSESLTPFEAKYHASGQTCWQLTVR